MPKCRNCRIRGHVCETTDPKNPELVVYRKQSGRDEGNEPHHTPSQSAGSPMSALPTTFDISSSRKEERSRSTPWIERSYSATRDPKANGIPSLSPIDRPRQQTHSNAPGQQQSHQSPDVAFNTDGSKHRRKLMGGSSLQSLTMFLDLYLDQAGLPHVAPSFRHGMKHVEEFLVPWRMDLPSLPPSSVTETYIAAFRGKIHPIFPVVSLSSIEAEIQTLRSFQDQSWSPAEGYGRLYESLEASDIPNLACVFAVISLGADEAAGATTEIGTTFLKAAYSLYPHLVGVPYVASVQALALITIALRGRNKEGQAFQVMGQALRIAHSIGLHRNISRYGIRDCSHADQSRTDEQALHARIWWVCFSLEKIFELETARPSCARRSDSDQTLPATIETDLPFFAHFVNLAVIQGQISNLLYRTKRGSETASHLLRSTALLDEDLSQWRSSVPEHIRPGEDLFCDEPDLRLAAFLSLQYHQAMITLHRAALVIPTQQYANEIEKIQPAIGMSARHRLRRGADLCVASARAIVKVDAELADSHVASKLFTITQSVLASVVLALNIVRNTKPRMIRSDLEMLVSETQFAEEQYRIFGQDEEFIKTCSTLRTSVMDFAHRQAQIPGSSLDGISLREKRQQLTPNSTDLHGAATIDASLDYRPTLYHPDLELVDPFQGVALEDLWTFMGSENAVVEDPLSFTQ